jgi:hypothetical protein
MARKFMARIAQALAILAAFFTAQPLAAFESVRIDGVTHIDAAALGESFGLRAYWTEPETRGIRGQSARRDF